MITTLFGAKKNKQGQNVGFWDGKDDFGEPVPAGSYKIKGLNSNIKGEWVGVIGNTSKNLSGATVHRGFERIFGVTILGDYLYYGNGYNEGRNSQFKVLLSDPQVAINAFKKSSGSDADQETNHLCNDGKKIFCAGVDPFSANKGISFVFAFLPDTSEVLFSAGQPLKMVRGRTYPKAISVVTNTNGKITSIASRSDYLFVARKGMNSIYVHDANTGAQLQILSRACDKITVDGNFLWVQAGDKSEKLSIGANGTLTPTGIVAIGLRGVQGMGAHNGVLYVMDGGDSQQLKKFDYQGHKVMEIGDLGGYKTSAAYSDNKFFFSNAITNTSAIAFQSNGDYWVVEAGNFCVKHFDPGDHFKDKIQYLPKVWSHTSVNGRAFGDYLEFSFTDNPFTWKQVANWGFNVPSDQDDNFKRLYCLRVLANGKTIALQKASSVKNAKLLAADFKVTVSWLEDLVENYDHPAAPEVWEKLDVDFAIEGDKICATFRDCYYEKKNSREGAEQLMDAIAMANGAKWEFVELAENLVFTDKEVMTDHSQLYPDGTIRRQNASNTVTNQPQYFYKRQYNFGGAVPIEGAESVIAISPPKTSFDPLYYGTRMEPYAAGEQMSDGSVISSDPNSDSYSSGEGYKLGKLLNGQWIYRIAKGTNKGHRGAFPANGRFDIGNCVGNAGGKIQVLDDLIFQSYHGEFWHSCYGDPGQTNKINIFNKNGIFIGQVGTTTFDSKHLGEAAPGMAGNAFYISVLKGTNKYIIHTNDESFHGGIGRWEVTGVGEVEEWETDITITQPVPKPATIYADLLAELAHRNQEVQNGERITRSHPNSGSNEITDMFKLNSGVKLFDERESADLFAEFGASLERTEDFYIDFKNDSTVETWSFTSLVTFERHYPNNDSENGFWLDLLDVVNRVIVRFYVGITFSNYNITVYANNKVIVTGAESTMRNMIDSLRPLSISCDAGIISVTYNETTIDVASFDSQANLTKPAKVRGWFHFKAGALKLMRKFGAAESRFYTVMEEPPEECYTEEDMVKAYNKGKEAGFIEGKEVGLEEGKEAGFIEGKEIGLKEGETNGKLLQYEADKAAIVLL